MNERTFSAEQIAAALMVSVSTVRFWMACGDLNAINHRVTEFELRYFGAKKGRLRQLEPLLNQSDDRVA